MADVIVHKASLAEGKVSKLAVTLHGLGDRVIERDMALAWMKDGHSMICMVDGKRGPALQLVEVEDGHSIRIDNQAEASDLLPSLPAV